MFCNWLLHLQKSMFSCRATGRRRCCRDLLDVRTTLALKSDGEFVERSVLFELDVHIAFDLVVCRVGMNELGVSVQDDVEFILPAESDSVCEGRTFPSLSCVDWQ